MKAFVIAVWMVALIAPASAGNLLFILDASGSMRSKIDGKPKIEIAKTTLIKLIGDLPPDMKVGLMAYGHRERSSCKDVEVLLPVGHASASEVSAQLAHIAAKGKTPIGYALEQSADAFVGLEKGPNNVVLISDGRETCNGDPCVVAGKLAKSNINVRVDVVGFDISDKDRKQLECIARLGKGKYFSAHSTDGFKAAVTKAVEVARTIVKPAPPPARPKPTKSVFFKDEFDGKGLKNVWQVKNPNPDAYIVEKGHLLMIAHGKSGFDVPKTPNAVQFKKEMPDGDWEMNTIVQADYTTGKEGVWMGLYGDDKNFIAARLYQAYEGAVVFNLEILKSTRGHQTKFKKAIRWGKCNWGGCEKTELPKLAKKLKMPMTLSLVKQGRKFLARATLQGDVDKKGHQIVYETAPVSSLRPPGGPVLAVGQSDRTDGETLFYFDRLEIDAVK